MNFNALKTNKNNKKNPQTVTQNNRGESTAVTSFRQEINRLFDNFFNDADRFFSVHKKTLPTLDIIENDKNFKLKAELPGMDPQDVDISITDSFLTISGEKKEEQQEEGQNYLRSEVAYGAFERTVALPSNANTDKAQADFKNGVLTVSVPKKAESLQKPKKLQIKKAA